MAPWWHFLRELFIKNEFWHYPDLVLLYMLCQKGRKASNDSERNAWLERLSGAKLLLDTGEIIPLEATKRTSNSSGPFVTHRILTDAQSAIDCVRYPKKFSGSTVVPFGIVRPDIVVRFPDEHKPAIQAAIRKLAQFRSYYNNGRMVVGRNSEPIDGPPLLSFRYIEVPLRSDLVYVTPSWSNSTKIKTPEETYHGLLCDTFDKNINDARLSEASIINNQPLILHALDLPRHCRARMEAEQPGSTERIIEFPVPDEVYDIYVRLTSQPSTDHPRQRATVS